MGIEAFSLRMLCEARRIGASFASTATLGRQHLSVRPSELEAVLRATGLSVPEGAMQATSGASFADRLLPALLGIETLVSIDYSGYEGASVVHDMNVPLPQDRWGSYDAVIDGGTLEHVFNVPVALASCMRMLKIGGRFYALTPANNHCGHGFFKFSPELFFRVFSPAQGFELEHVMAIEHPFPGIELSSRRTVYAVTDPARVGGRVGLVTRRPVYLFVQAIKRADVEPFAVVPQQSDYVSAWTGGAGDGTYAAGAVPAPALYERLPYVMRRYILGVVQRWKRDSFRNRQSFRPWNGVGRPPRV
jgi:SAM-dependent methyltransferase